MRTLLLSATLLATVVAPAVAAPRTIICGPFQFTAGNGQPAQIGPLTFVIDAAASAGQVIEPNGEPTSATVQVPNQHLVSVQFYSRALMGDTTTYQVDINNDHGGATLATYSDSRTPFAKAQCHSGSRVVF